MKIWAYEIDKINTAGYLKEPGVRKLHMNAFRDACEMQGSQLPIIKVGSSIKYLG